MTLTTQEFIVVFLVLLVVVRAERLSEVLRDLFRGGPRPPSHPIPADDSRILNRRAA